MRVQICRTKKGKSKELSALFEVHSEGVTIIFDHDPEDFIPLGHEEKGRLLDGEELNLGTHFGTISLLAPGQVRRELWLKERALLKKKWALKEELKSLEKELYVLPDYGCGPNMMKEEERLKTRVTEIKQELGYE